MKPQELLNYCGGKISNYNYCRAETRKNINPYLDKDCVIAYDKNKLGVIFIMKSKKKYFGFVGIKRDIYLGGHGYTFGRIWDLREVISLLGDDCNILNKEEFMKIKKKIIVENL